MIWLILLASQSASALDFWPQFYGQYTVHHWTCESTIKDKGCHETAGVRIEALNGSSQLSILNAQGHAIRINDLIENTDSKGTTYVLTGDEHSAAFTVESFDSKGSRYFYNLLRIERTGAAGALVFSQIQESNVAGFGNSLKRIFALSPDFN